jgi:asparagine synthase (glutamine-hydrolysing)
MCGFAAILSLTGAPIDRERLRGMTTILRHRGPDDEGYVLADARTGNTVAARGRETMSGLDLPALDRLPDRPFTFGLGVRRLSIRDRGPLGHQPMGDSERGLWLAFNGEVYGDAALRARLVAHPRWEDRWAFSTRCDTETALTAMAVEGLDALPSLTGMWAFALWDARRRRLACARDPFGIKPLYYMVTGTELLVGSEIKAILAGLTAMPAPNPQVVVDYLTARISDHTPETFFEGILQVPPGHLLVADERGVSVRAWHDPRAETPAADGEAAGARFHHALTAAVHDHLQSDERVGATLSGGLDSSTIVVAASELMARSRAAPLDVFTATFDDPAHDEQEFADEVVTATRSRAHYVRIEPHALADAVPRALWHQDEPVFSTSVLAQWQVMKQVAASGVRVVLDGQGADEWLGGYPAVTGAHVADRLRTGDWRAALDLVCEARTAGDQASVTGRAALAFAPGSWQSLTARLAQRQLHGLHPDLAGYWRPIVRAPDRAAAPRRSERGAVARSDRHVAASLETMIRTTSLPALLRALDRNGMAWSVEPRVPFLDSRVTTAARDLSNDERFRHGLRKWILRDPRWSRLPERVRTRGAKNGFATPEASWWRGPLREWAADVLAPSSVARHRWLDAAVVEGVRQQLLAGDTEGGASIGATSIWRWINLELWTDACEQRALGRVTGSAA